MGGYFALLRPGNGVVAAVAVVAGAIAGAGPEAVTGPRQLLVAAAAASAFIFIGAGNSLNDYFDREIDRTAHPTRPIPSGRVKPESARAVAVALFAASMGLALYISLQALVLVATSAAVMILYELRLKNLGLPGNVAIGYLSGITFYFGGFIMGHPREMVPLFVLAVVATMGREIAKDIQDKDADKGRETYPQTAGPERAARLSAACTVAAVLLGPLPFLLGDLGWVYALVALPAYATFIYAAYVVRRDPAKSQRLSKVGMALATLAFAVGGWFS